MEVNKVDNNYYQHWNEKFLAGEWGRYPPEDLVRFIGRNFKKTVRSQIRILEVGCGPGANIWFLHREGYDVAGIDGSPAAIEQVKQRIQRESAGLNTKTPDMKVGNFANLPWEDNSFDVVVDVFAIYANTVEVIDRTLSEVHRVLKPGGRFYSKMWGTQTTGFGLGQEIEKHTFKDIPSGPCFNMGVSHFFDEAEIQARFSSFQIDSIDKILRSDRYSKSFIEEIVCEATKPKDV
jgi:SAM-dependent methyltransferase